MAKASRIEERSNQQPLCCACWMEHNKISCRCGKAAPSSATTTQRQTRFRRDEEQLELF